MHGEGTMSAARAEWARIAAMRIAAAIEELARSRASMDSIIAERNIYHAYWREQQERADRLKWRACGKCGKSGEFAGQSCECGNEVKR